MAEPLSLPHKFLRPRRPAGGRPPALVLLHGRGADEDDLLGLAQYFDERLFVIAPRAPFPHPTGGGHTWYDLEEIGKPDRGMFLESYGRLRRFLAQAREQYGLDDGRTFACGFSMGAIMTFAIALTEPDLLAGVMAHSGYIPEDAGVEFRWEGVIEKPFFIAHGLYDPVIPYAYSRRARELLEKAGARVTHREYDMGHQINEESLGDMIAWLVPMLDHRPGPGPIPGSDPGTGPRTGA